MVKRKLQKEKLVVTGTSSLLPNNSAWSVLSDKFDLVFSDFGLWDRDLIDSEMCGALFCAIHLQDIVDQTNSSGVQKVLDMVAGLIETRLKSTKETTIITISSQYIVHEIGRSRTISPNLKYKWELFQLLEKLLNRYASLHVIDLDESFLSAGSKIAFDTRNWCFARCRYSTHGLRRITSVVNSVLNRRTKPPAKVLVLDCDNTLWGGIIGEDGLSEIVLGDDGIGSAFVDFQKSVQRKCYDGTILALASKNEELDVLKVFEEHPSMVLKKKDIVSIRVNWQEKYKNIVSMAEELDLALDSFVFWDDNPLERDKIKKFLPEVHVVDVPDDVMEWAALLDGLECLCGFNVTESDRKKTDQYRAHAAFKQGASSASNINQYLRSLNLSPSKVIIDSLSISRAHQLVTKTNQFNLRTKRYTLSDIEEFQSDPDNNFMISLSDVYGNHGIVGLVCLKKLSSDTIFIDTLLLSCRVLGRFLETWVMSQIIDSCSKQQVSYIVGEYIPTERNGLVSDFFRKHGLKLLSDQAASKSIHAASNGGAIYVAKINEVLLPNIDIYQS